MKICRDCKHQAWNHYYCAHPNAIISQSNVTGRYDLTTCGVMRGDGPCGPDGKLWERKPWWEVW